MPNTQELSQQIVRSSLLEQGFSSDFEFDYNLPPAVLVEKALALNEGELSSSGALIVDTTPYTGRSPKDKYIVEHEDPDLWLASGTEWMARGKFEGLKAKMLAHLSKQPLFVRDVKAGADPENLAKVRVISNLAWHSLAAANLFIKNEGEPWEKVDFQVIVDTEFEADPSVDGTRSPAFIILDFKTNVVLIGKTRYSGEIKKSVFTFMNYRLPKKGVLPLHCSANIGTSGDVALFFGLSGTGKTTLSSDPDRALIGDDEHGWSGKGVFNFEGGCFAKTIRLNPKYEPLVWSAINRFGCLIENVPMDADRVPDFNSDAKTENTRAAYPLAFIPNFVPSGQGGHPNHIFFLTADAFGVLPPLSKLNTDQAMYYFLSGYTSKLAGTERGLGDKPETTFSTCFGAPFLPLQPAIYAELLARQLKTFGTQVWLLNTGWSGGAYGIGTRMALPLTRRMISAVLGNELSNMPTHIHPIFNLQIPDRVDGVPSEVLDPEKTWSDKDAYDMEARMLAAKFVENFKKYEKTVSEAVTKSGPAPVSGD
ncbi:MAG TPA: phosphoenolpyruvate carboxykinase (ATP) [Anaerolineaceae bacterium]|nr:phosphoenolpyruvate carboxykinase (ATP) [Anaerolineaceae bacterium]